MDPKDFVWTEKYRPARIEDCVLPDRIKEEVRPYIASGKIPNMLFSGSPGCGKTTLAIAMCKELGADYMFINASDENGIDVLRTKIRQYASTISFSGGQKIVILDESDNLSQTTQTALRGFLEEFTGHCSFIFTANYINRIIKPLQSRLAHVDFNLKSDEKMTMAKLMLRRCCDILDKENIEYDKKAIAGVITQLLPDFRKTISQLQRYSIGGSIDSGILASMQDVKVEELVSALKAKNFSQVRKWVTNNNSLDPAPFYRELYDSLQGHLVPQSIPQMILHIGDYQFRASNSVDHEINNMCCLISIMRDCQFKE